MVIIIGDVAIALALGAVTFHTATFLQLA